MAMIHIKCHAQPVNTGFPAVLCGGRKEKNVRILKIKTKTGIKTVNEVITENEDNSFTIFINANLCESKRLKAINHVIRHIKERDFEKIDVQKIEMSAHK